jgi:hypothetical protein
MSNDDSCDKHLGTVWVVSKTEVIYEEYDHVSCAALLAVFSSKEKAEKFITDAIRKTKYGLKAIKNYKKTQKHSRVYSKQTVCDDYLITEMVPDDIIKERNMMNIGSF